MSDAFPAHSGTGRRQVTSSAERERLSGVEKGCASVSCMVIPPGTGIPLRSRLRLFLVRGHPPGTGIPLRSRLRLCLVRGHPSWYRHPLAVPVWSWRCLRVVLVWSCCGLVVVRGAVGGAVGGAVWLICGVICGVGCGRVCGPFCGYTKRQVIFINV